MQHVGHQYPRTPKCKITPDEFPDSPPSRRGKVVCLHATVGTVAALWADKTVNSDLVDYDPEDTSGLIYTFTNPTDSLATIEVRFHVVLIDTTVGAPGHYMWRVNWRALYSGLVIADQQNNQPPNDAFHPSTTNNAPGNPWLHLVNPVLWQSLNIRFNTAPWSASPEYHPYRIGP